MFDIVAVSFPNSTNKYYFSSNNLPIKKNDKVIVEIENKLEMGTCKTNVFKEKKENIVFPLKYVKRLATPKDIKQYNDNQNDSAKVLIYAKSLAKKLNLKMNFITKCL